MQALRHHDGEETTAARLCDGLAEILDPLQAEIARFRGEMEAIGYPG